MFPALFSILCILLVRNIDSLYFVFSSVIIVFSSLMLVTLLYKRNQKFAYLEGLLLFTDSLMSSPASLDALIALKAENSLERSRKKPPSVTNIKDKIIPPQKMLKQITILEKLDVITVSP